MKSKKKLALVLVLGVLTLAAVVCGVVMSVLGGKLQSQRADERWRGESGERYAQVSVFFPVGSELDENSLYSFHETINSKLLEAGLEQPDSGSLWTECYSAKGRITVEGTRGSSQAVALGVGGDFFTFHPLDLRSGSYISGSDLMDDRVILDEELAWKLFGAVDLAGLTVNIGGEPYYIAGVVSREDDRASSKAYNDGPGLFMSYSALERLGACSGISCYELVCADPISGFASSVVSDGLSNGGAYPVVENSVRYSLSGIFGVIGDFGERSMNNYGVVYPYWENAARMIEDYMALCLVLLLLFAAAPAIFAVVFAIVWLRRGTRAAKTGAVRLAEGAQDRHYKHLAERREGRERRRAAEKRARAIGRHARTREKETAQALRGDDL